MATGNDVLAAMALSDDNKADATVNLAAINAAIHASWPQWRLTEYASGGTLAASTFSYSLAALTTIEPTVGVFSVSVIPTNYPPVDVSHRCRQYYDHSASAWTLEIAAAVTGNYSTYPFYVEYQYRHPQLATLASTVYAPVSALAKTALLWMAMYGATEQNVDNAFWRAFAPEHLRDGELWKGPRSMHLPHRVAIGKGHA